MPLSQPSGYRPPDSRLDQIPWRGDMTSDKSIQETILEPGQKGRGEAALGKKGMGPGFSFKNTKSTQHKTGKATRNRNRAHWARTQEGILSRSIRISVWLPYARISTASLSICSSVRPGLRLMIFRSYAVISLMWPFHVIQSAICTHSICDPVCEAHKLDLVARSLPVGVEGQDQPQRRGLRVGVVVRQGDVSEGRHGAVNAVTWTGCILMEAAGGCWRLLKSCSRVVSERNR